MKREAFGEMDEIALDLCCSALECDPTTVAGLHERAELLPALLATIALRLPHLHRPAQDPADLVAAIARQWPPGKPFGAGEILRWAEGQRSDQRDLLARLRSACRRAPDSDLTSNLIGKLFGGLDGKTGGLLVRVSDRGGSGRWSVRGVGG